MTEPVVREYRSGAPVPPARRRAEKVVLFAAAIVLGAVIGWRMGRDD